jgi:hypothetical protein
MNDGVMRSEVLAIIVAGALVAGSILLHAYVSRPPRYQIVSIGNHVITRLDTQTGQAIMCLPGDGYVYECSSR